MRNYTLQHLETFEILLAVQQLLVGAMLECIQVFSLTETLLYEIRSEHKVCSVPDQGILGPVPPVTETLRADSRAVTCCPEDGRLTIGGWVVVIKE